jgi:tRNA A-37 threonylcarbamoyl transferase component Bud32
VSKDGDRCYRFRIPGVHGEPRPSIFRRVLSWICGTRYAGEAREGFVPPAQMAARIEDLDSSFAGGRMIKVDMNIDVCQARWGGRDVVIKRYKHVGIIHSIRHTFKRSRGYRSWLSGRRLVELGIPTPLPLAYIDVHKGPLLWQSYAITAYVDGPTLYHLLESQRVSDGTKRRMVRQALHLIERLGELSIGHGDMKRTNLLCARSLLVLTDLDVMKVHWCGWIRALRQARDTRRFLRGLSAPREAAGALGTFIRHWGSCRRWLKQDFDRLDSGTCRLVIRRALRDDALEHVLLGQAGGVQEQYQATTVSSGPSSRVCRFTVTLNGAAKQVYHKQFLRRSSLDLLKSVIFRSRAKRALRGAVILADHGFETPEIVAMGETRPTWFERSGFLVTLEVAGAGHLYQWVQDYSTGLTEQRVRDKREFIQSLGRLVGRLHRAGIVHGDLRPGNVLARKEDGQWRFFLLDNERTRKWPWLPGWLRLKNLVQINMIQRSFLSASDRIRFFDAYLAENPSLVGGRKRWMQRVARKTARRLERIDTSGVRSPRDDRED